MTDTPREPAARVQDEIAHGYGLLAMVGGALVGVAAGVAIVGATALTGGVAAVVIAGAIAGGGLAGDQIASGLETIFDLPEPTSGVLTLGSPNVFVNGRASIRAELSSASSCNGLPFNHPPWPGSILVREGSASVFVNKQPASRLKCKLTCGAHIKTASPNVLIGGETVQTGFVFDLESWTRTGLQILGIGAVVGAGVFAAMAGAAAFGAFVGIGALGLVGMEGVGLIGDAIGPGYRDLLQGVVGMGLIIGGPKLARRGSGRGVADEDIPPPPKDNPFLPKKLGELEEGAVPITPELQAGRDAAKARTGQTADGYPPLSDEAAQTFGPGVRPWKGEEGQRIVRVVDQDSNPSGSFWQRVPLEDEASWRGGAAVRNDWNGDGAYVEAPAEGLRGWVGPAAPQDASVPGHMLPGGGEQIWIPRDAAQPGLPIPTPWNGGSR